MGQLLLVFTEPQPKPDAITNLDINNIVNDDNGYQWGSDVCPLDVKTLVALDAGSKCECPSSQKIG
jgi:hypothetical protein